MLDMYEDLEKQDEVRGIVKIHAPSSRKSLLNDSSKVTGVLKAKLRGLAIEDKRNADQLPKVPKIFYGKVRHIIYTCALFTVLHRRHLRLV